MRLFAFTVLLAAAFGCEREDRRLREIGPAVGRSEGNVMSPLHPGLAEPPEPPPVPDYSANAFEVSEGQRLYRWFNCVGCHANGGGGIGPALMDEKWIYGSEPLQVFDTIVEGRPNGMPSFRGRIADYQVWQLVAYVRSLSGLVEPDAVSNRTDHMQSSPSGVMTPGLTPVPVQANHP
jgi:cytochrome c oxidase cbb3-type subunit III